MRGDADTVVAARMLLIFMHEGQRFPTSVADARRPFIRGRTYISRPFIAVENEESRRGRRWYVLVWVGKGQGGRTSGQEEALDEGVGQTVLLTPEGFFSSPPRRACPHFARRRCSMIAASGPLPWKRVFLAGNGPGYPAVGHVLCHVIVFQNFPHKCW